MSRKVRGQNVYTPRELILQDIRELLNVKEKKSRKIFNAIFQAIAAALQRGEKVHIKGFGVFRIVDIPPYQVHGRFVKGNQRQVHTPVPITVPGKKRVKFRPSDHLRALVNPDCPSYNIQDAIRSWK